MPEENEGVMDESLASEEAPEEEAPEETAEESPEEPEEEQGEEEPDNQVANLNKAVSGLRRELRKLREENIILRAQKQPEKEEEPEAPDEGYLTAGQVKKLVQKMVEKGIPKQDSLDSIRVEMLNASEEFARSKHADYVEVTEGVKGELEDDPGLKMFIVGNPGTWMNAAERLYQYGLMKRGQSGKNGNRKKTIDAIVKKGAKPATMGLQSKKSPSQKGQDISTMDIEEYRAAVKKNPDLAKKILGG